VTERELTVALDPLVDRCDGQYGDWPDVLRRAGVTLKATVAQDRPRGMLPAHRPVGRARRVGVVALATLILAAVVLVSTGFGRDALRSLVGRIDVEFGASEPAPAVVRWRFEDLAIGAPPSFAPDAIASQARTVGALRIGGKERALSVVPTRGGGFCFEIENSSGGCVPDPGGGPMTRTRLSASPTISVDPRPNAPSYAQILGVQGMVSGDEIERLAIEFADGASQDLDFVYVSEPIDAGFFGYTVPEDRQRGSKRPCFVVGRNAAGEIVARRRIYFPKRPPAITPGQGQGPSDRTLPARPSPPPSAPIQRGAAHGVSVTAGANGSVLFDATRIAPERRALLEGAITYACFELVKRGGVLRGRGLGQEARFQPTVGFRAFGIDTPFDGCEVRGGYGHIWPDRLGNHSVIEVPFSEAGRHFFEDRAAARDLAIFLSRGAMAKLRRRSPPLSAAELERQFGTRIAALGSRDAAPPAGMIGYWVEGSRTVFRRASSTGHEFEVVVGPNGGVRSENVRPLAFVF
jgi:hypothetical protein